MIKYIILVLSLLLLSGCSNINKEELPVYKVEIEQPITCEFDIETNKINANNYIYLINDGFVLDENQVKDFKNALDCFKIQANMMKINTNLDEFVKSNKLIFLEIK